jgi:sugar O-acyltransferase (sialic acid O-acetyltransferase NeuD family)
MERLVIVGAGGFGREVFSMIREINQVRQTWEVIGFLDDNPASLDGFSHYPPVLGPIEHYRDLQSARATCAVGSPKARKQIAERLDGQGARWATITHPTVRIGVGSTVAAGCILCARSSVTVDVRVGNHVHINCVAGAGHDVQIGDFCTLSAHVDVCGKAVLEEGVLAGSHAVVLPNVRIGAWATLGAGSVAIRNVAPGKTVFGVPAKEIFMRTVTVSADDTAPTSEAGGR